MPPKSSLAPHNLSPPLRQLFLQHVAQTSPQPLLLEITHAEGIFLYDALGKAYYDAISGISVSNLGHGNPAVVAAVQQQAANFMHLMVYGEVVHAPQVQFAHLLCQNLPQQQLNSVYFVNSGAEAVDGALKLAKRYTGRTQLVGFNNAYHGSTHAALSLMGNEYFKQAYRPLLPDVKHLPFNNEVALQQITQQTAAVLMEVVQAEAGVILPNPKFLTAVRQRCNEVGALLIFDEIQTGLGRTGTLFAFEQFSVIPDILLLAKALGAGMPIGAFITSQQIMEVLKTNPVLGHITTFGGHPVCCAAGLAGLQVLLSTNYINEVEQKSALFGQLLKHPKIINLRRAGLLMAIEFESEQFNQQVITHCLQRGLLTDWFLFAPNCLRLAPPLTITTEQIRAICQLIIESINAEF
ncbi:MAG: aspartate aminotransferase family protein [Sphingobacteriales bacterium]|jgi:acetylornithine/N-succinyldiaminopimelate aminotransferase|nr:aspartate aminotransferase family protein [Sphingobacteriales bacterium]MBP9141563.1 aspartate aminotransferase family protein [Chitinophagales bacterium]MDA0198666.1 aspartate aminotransferase family protein [Bacteroidota bacterium]MBK6889810.1 aspartate aminotransferase family protein [Sphingobacteriales bacterium]MBK7527672.1 aspartate aminotransferase family protein [Sphingobacteriales bacterium]